MSTPSSIIHVCSGVLLNNKYLHTIWFNDHAEQLRYFAGKVVKTFSAYTYIRKSWSIKVEATMEQARTWTYLYFQNGNGKTYFYFINNIEYISDHTVELFIEMDVMQTYLHEYTLHRCFVEREHSATDEIGDNLLDEGLELGELVMNAKNNVAMQDLCIMFLCSFNPFSTTKDNPVQSFSHNYEGVFCGLGVYTVALSEYATLGSLLSNWDAWGISDGVVSMWMYPKSLVTLKGGEWNDGKIKEVSGATSINVFAERPEVLDDYVPRNKKLLTYPFNFLYVSNNAGGSAVYQYEKFSNPSQCGFRVSGSLTPEGSVKLYPINYKGIVVCYEEGIMGGSYPTCAWNQDVYKLWLAQNQNQNAFAVGSSLLTIAGGVASAVATGGAGLLVGGGVVVHGATQITSLLAQKRDKEIQPPQAKGNYSSNINIVNEHQTFSFMTKSVDSYHAAIIDEYFDMYGYKTNRVKIPNRNVRTGWTYTKTIDCHVSGSLCTDDLLKIQSIYDNGVTFWKNGDNIGNYGGSNACL